MLFYTFKKKTAIIKQDKFIGFETDCLASNPKYFFNGNAYLCIAKYSQIGDTLP